MSPHPDMNVEEGHLGGYIRGSHFGVPTEYDYEHGDPSTWTPGLWRWTSEALGVRSVLDVGCGEGHSAGFFRSLGCRVIGVDGSLHARRDSLIPDIHVVHDFVQGSYFPPDDFDLVWSCEFVEHVEERYVDHFLATFESSRAYIMMTFATPGQPGHHHVNCQNAEYWIERISCRGFVLDEGLTAMSRSMAGDSHYSERGLLFARR